MTETETRHGFPFFPILALLFLWCGCFTTFHLTSVDNAGICTALRNWDEYGYSNLRGQFVINPGGIAPGEELQLYLGHRTWSILPQYVIGHLLGGPTHSLLPFYLILSTTVGVSIWFFFKKSESAALLATLVVLCPGFSRYAIGYDPIGIPILWGIPAMLLIVQLMTSEKAGAWKRMSLAFIILLLYVAMNWSVIFPVSSALVCLLLIKPARIKFLLPVVILSAFLVILVTYASLSTKYGSGTGTPKTGAVHNAFQAMWDNYLWGRHGYGGGHTMTLFKALPRMLAANTIGLFPLILYFIYQMVREFRRAGFSRVALSLAPLATVILGILTLRNLFGHHSWMAGPPLMAGMIFSLALMERRRESAPSEEPSHANTCSVIRTAALIGAAVYMFFMLLISRAYMGGAPEVIDLVTKNTSRHSLILLAPDLPSQFRDESDRMAAEFDRKVAPYPEWKSGSTVPAGGVYVLSSVPHLEKELSAVDSTTAGNELGKSLFSGLFRFYQVHIAKRDPGEKLELDSPYYLYRLVQP